MSFRLQMVMPFAHRELRVLFKRIYDDGFDDFKAGVVILWTEGLLLMTTLGVIEVAVGHRFLPPKRVFIMFSILVVLGLIALNDYVLLSKPRVARCEAEFKSLGGRQRMWGRLAVLAFILGSFAAVILVAGLVRELPQ